MDGSKISVQDEKIDYVDASKISSNDIDKIKTDQESDDEKCWNTSEEDSMIYDLQFKQSGPVYLNSEDIEFYTPFVLEAVAIYNKQNDAEIQFLNIVKANLSFSFSTPTHITFTAKDGPKHAFTTYQTKVFVIPEGVEIVEVRKKTQL